MDLEPVLLEASLGTVFGHIVLALGAGVVIYELLVELFALLHVDRRVVDAVLLVLPDVLKRALIVFALTDMDHLVGWWVWDTVPNLSRDAYSRSIHDARFVHACGIREK